MELTFRHGIIRHQIDISGTATFLRKSGSNDEYIDLVCDEDSVTFAIAHGNANYLIVEPKSINHCWGPLTAHGETQYLFWDISLLNGSLSHGYTTVNPFFGTNEPSSPILDQHWYDTAINQMKVWNGSKWVPKLRLFAGIYQSNAIVVPHARGSQINQNVACKAGNILLGQTGQPLRDTDGTFITSESNLIASHTSSENLRLETIQMFAEAIEFIPSFSFVTFEVPGKVKLASSNRPDEVINGIMLHEYFPGQVGNIIANGIVRNEQWSFLPSEVNRPIYINATGEITLIEPSMQDKYVVGYVFDPTAIFVDIQWRGGIGQIQSVVNISLTGDVNGSGLSSSAINTTLSNSGVTAGTYNNVTVNAKGLVTSATDEPYLLHNEAITITGDATGSGTTSIPLTLADTGVTVGTYNTVTVDSKGRVLSGVNVAGNNVNPLLINFANVANLDVENWSSKLLDFDSSDFLGTNYGLGTQTNPGDVVVALRNTGVAPGTYNNVTVDAKGRVTSASNTTVDLSSTLTGDVTGTGSSTIPTTLSNTGVAPGTYNNVEVDAKGRVLTGTNVDYSFATTLTGVITGTGTGTILTSMSPTGVVPGTYNNFTVTADGRIVSASTLDYDTDTTLTGDISGNGRGIINTTLSDTGVTPGNYNSVTVDSKGRVTAGSIQNYSFATTLTGDVTGTGTGTFATTLANSGVVAGTYNSVTVDEKGRVTAGSIQDYSFATTLTGDVTGSGTGTFAATLTNTGVVAGTYNSVTVDAKGRVIGASNIVDTVGATNLDELTDVTLTSPSNTQVLQYNGSQWVNATLSIPSGGVEYLPDLLDVTITTPAANQSLLWNGTEWVNQPLDRIVSQFNNLTSRILVDQAGEIITHNINNSTFITTTPTITAIGKSSPPEFWYALFDAGTVLQTNVEFHATCIDADTNDDIVVGGFAKNTNAGSAIQNKAFVVKYDRLGNIIWQKGFQGAATQSSPTSTPTTIEALVINQSDTTTYVGLTSDAESSIVKLDMLGNIVWQTKFDTYYGVISDMVIRANDSSLFVSGYQSSNGYGYIGKINMTTGAVDFFYELQRFRTYALELSSSGNELFVGGDLYDSPLDNNFANIFKFNVTGNSFTFVSNVTVNLTGGKRYVELKRLGTSIYALGTQPASSGSMGDYSIIKYNEATLAVEASKQFYDAYFVRYVNAVGMSLDINGNVYVLGYEGDSFTPSNNQLSLTKFNSSLVLEWQKTFGHPTFGDRHYNLNGIVTNGIAVYITGSTFDTYASSGLILKYPQDGSITGTFGTYVIANDSKFEGTTMHTVQSIVPSTITSLTPNTTSSVISLAQSNVSHLSFISISGGVDYYIDLIGQLQINGSAGNAGQVLSSNGGAALPSWNTLAIPSTLDNLSDVSINSSFPLMASDVLTYHLGEWKNSQLPIASYMTTGVVKIGSGLSIDGSGLLSATASATNLDGLSDVVITSPTTNQLLQYNGTSWVNTSGGITLSQYSTDANFASITTQKARGTSTTPTAILSGDRIFGLYSKGYHSGAAFSPNSAAIQFIASENYTSTAQGNYISFETTKNTTNVRLEQIRITNQGHLEFAQLGQRIIGDFGNATHANRPSFQSNVANNNTMIPILPNGISTTAGIFAANNSNVTNSAFAQLVVTSTYAGLASGALGTGTFLPISFLTNNTEQVRILETVAAVNYLSLRGSVSNQPVVIGVNGTDANASINISSKGTGEIQLSSNTIAQSNGNFSTYGDAISREYIMRSTTTNATQTELFTNGGTFRLTLANDSTWKFQVLVVARRTDVNDESASFTLDGCIDRNASAATTALVGTVTLSNVIKDSPAWDVTVNADTTNGALRILVTGEAGKTIRWVAFVKTIEVIG